jgi:hypothetical protein
MNHQQAVETLKTLPKNKGWSTTKAMSVIQALDRDSFTSPTDYAEAVTAAMIGQRWESVHGKQGYDTASTLVRWMGRGAAKYGNPETLFDAKTHQKGIGYSEKVPERASKATDYLQRREAGGLINGVIFHTQQGVFFQLGIDHESTTPQFGKRKRPIVGHEALPQFIDGAGGILPAILLSSTIKWNGDGFDGLDEAAVQEVNRKLAEILEVVLGGVDMERLQKHLDEQATKAIKQATDKMLKNKTARNIVAEEVAANPKALEAALQKALASGKLAEFLASLSPEEKEQIRDALG